MRRIPILPLLLPLIASLLLTACTAMPDPDTPPTQLPSLRWTPDGPPRGHVIALHAFGDTKAAWERLGTALAERGYTVLAYDQRGFGEAGQRGRWYGTDVLLADLVAQAEAEAAGSDAPLYLLGESMGAGLALIAASGPLRERVEGVVAAAPAVREGLTFRWAYNAALWLGANLAGGVTVPIGLGEADTMTPEAKRRLTESPLVLDRIRIDTYWGLIQLSDAASRAAYTVAAPTLMLYGGQDGIVDPRSVRHAFAALEGTRRAVFAPQAGHLILHDIHGDAARDAAIAWIEGARAVGAADFPAPDQ